MFGNRNDKWPVIDKENMKSGKNGQENADLFAIHLVILLVIVDQHRMFPISIETAMQFAGILCISKLC